MRKLEIYGSLALVGFRLLGGLVGWKEVLEVLEMGYFQTLQNFQQIPQKMNCEFALSFKL